MERWRTCASASRSALRANPSAAAATGSAKDIERSHRDLESLALASDPLRLGYATVAEAQRRERMRRNDVDALLDLQARSIGIDDERRDSLRGGRTVRPLLARAWSARTHSRSQRMPPFEIQVLAPSRT
jgi:hypothetical protein